MNNENVNVVILLDLKKKRPLMLLTMISWLKSLKYMDSIKKALALFNFYMRNRTQQVQIGNALSDKCPVKYGVPQGSIPGPLLFM